MVIYVPGTEETDPKKQNMSLQAIAAAATTIAASTATNTANISSNTTAIAALTTAACVIPFSATGCVGNGTTDDTTNFQALLTANPSNVILDGQGKTYKITAAVTIPASSQYMTIQNAVFLVTGDINFLSVASGTALFTELKNLKIDSSGQTTVGRTVIDFSRMTKFVFDRVWINGASGKTQAFFGAGVGGVSPYNGNWYGCYGGNIFAGILFNDAAGSAQGCNTHAILGCEFQAGTGNFGIYVGAFSQNITIFSTDLESVGGTGIYLDGIDHLIAGCRFESQTTAISVTANCVNSTIGKSLYSSNTANISWFGSSRANNTILWDPDSSGSISSQGGILSRNPTQGLGYAAGAGGSVTQITNQTTGVTLNKTSGAITLFSAAGTASWQFFTVTNSTVAATDTISLSVKSGNANGVLHFVNTVAAGSFQIGFSSLVGTATAAPVINFNVIKGVII